MLYYTTSISLLAFRHRIPTLFADFFKMQNIQDSQNLLILYLQDNLLSIRDCNLITLFIYLLFIFFIIYYVIYKWRFMSQLWSSTSSEKRLI